MPTLTVLNGQSEGTQVKMAAETIFIGRDKSNQLILPDRFVSRKHAVINYLTGRFVLSDLKSMRGTWVDGRKISEIDLKDGQQFMLGDISISFNLNRAEKMKNDSLFKKMFLVFLVSLLVGGGFLFFSHKQDVSEIEKIYKEGVHAMNNKKNILEAKRAFEKVLDLDPKKKTEEGLKAEKLLKIIKQR